MEGMSARSLRALEEHEGASGGVYVAAKDTPSNGVLREKPGIIAEKAEWLKRSGRECGDLYGMLPLVLGMPMALTDHIDRNPDKQLLRGNIGILHSWVLEDGEFFCLRARV